MSLLAIDIGSSACKAVAFDSSGAILAQGSAPCEVEFPRPSFAEMLPEKFWHAVCRATRAATQELATPVEALCLSSHGESIVPVNAGGDPVGPVILNQDGRATAEAEEIERTVGREHVFEITGLVTHAMYPLPKILWLRKHQPEIFSAATNFITVIGYILHRMGLPALVDFSLASRYFAFDIHQRRWSDEILDQFGLTADLFPETAPAGTIVGKLSADAANQLGIPAGTPVVLGGHDQPCAALGSGVTAPGAIADSIGTYECLTASTESPIVTGDSLRHSLNTYCHVIPNKYVTLAFFPSGIMLKWFHDLVYANGSGTESDHYSSLERDATPGPSGLSITPHLIGTCSPDFNPQARGAILGLTPGTSRSDIYKAILEGISCEFAGLSRILEQTVGAFNDVFVTGGGSRSSLGLRLRASLSGKRLHTMPCSEAVCLGSAVLASVAVGEHASIRDAVNQMVHETAAIDPEPELAAMYKSQIQQYDQVRKLTLAIHS